MPVVVLLLIVLNNDLVSRYNGLASRYIDLINLIWQAKVSKTSTNILEND